MDLSGEQRLARGGTSSQVASPSRHIKQITTCVLLVGSYLAGVIGCGTQEPHRHPRPPEVYHHYPERDFCFSGMEWSVRGGHELQGAGPNYWGGSHHHVDHDQVLDEVTLRVGPDRHGVWRSAEISTWIPPDTTTLEIDFEGLPEELDPNIVLGVFVYRNDESEFDLELSSWGHAKGGEGEEPYHPIQFVVVPPIEEGHMHRFSPTTEKGLAAKWTQRFEWQEDFIVFTLEQDGEVLSTWRYEGEDVPRYDDHRLHINLWLFEGRPPINREPVDVTITRVAFSDQTSTR